MFSFAVSIFDLSLKTQVGSCHCVFIYSNLRGQLVSLLRDSSLCCFCLLVESYETINQSITDGSV